MLMNKAHFFLYNKKYLQQFKLNRHAQQQYYYYHQQL